MKPSAATGSSTEPDGLAEFLAESARDRASLIEALERDGFLVLRDRPTERTVELDAPEEGTVRFGVVSDTHLGHRHQQLTHLRDFYAKATDFKADFILHAGDFVDGQNMHRDQQFELFRHGVDAQARYAAEHYPVLRRGRKVLATWVIGGNHDAAGWNDAGANVLRQVAAEREDIEFLGAPTATFVHGGLRIMLMHPDGGVAYARSYKLQKIVEGFEADAKPHLLFCGHWHVAAHVPALRNVEAFAVPCFQSQTAFMRRKGLQPVIGGILVEASWSARGLEDLRTWWVLYRTPILEDY